MANTKSAKKAIRKILRRTRVNKSRRTGLRTCLRQVEDAIAGGDQQGAREALKRAEPALARAAQKKVIHKNTAARKTSRLSARIAVMTK